MFVKKLTCNPRNECFILVLKDLFACSTFPFFTPQRKWKKIVSGHPYIFSQIFQFSLQTEKPLWAQPTWESTVPLSIWIRPKPKKMGSSFHQVIPTRIKVFRRCKNTENEKSHGCLQGAEDDPGDRSPGCKEHCHLQVSCYAILLSYKAIYKLWVWSRIFRTWLRCADTTYLWAMQDPGNPP